MKAFRSSVMAAALMTLSACGDSTLETSEAVFEKDDAVSMELQAALSALPDAEVADLGGGGVPTFLRGNLGRAQVSSQGFGSLDAHRGVADALTRIAPAFRVRASDLSIQSVSRDELSYTHLRYAQMKNGLRVVNGDLVVHVNNEGTIYAANGNVRDGVNLPATPRIAAEAASVAAARSSSEVRGVAAGAATLVYLLGSENQKLDLAYQVEVTGEAASGLPVRDLVYVSAEDGSLLERHPQIHSAMNRALYSANNGTSLPGTLRRSEGGAATGDSHIDENYAHLGTTYNCYSTNFARDSYNNAGAQMRSTVHYSTNYVNAFWNGSQMVYGDGDGSQSGPLGKDLDVTVHELTHAVTSSESNLTYSNESGALNEGMSDIFAAYCESWTRSWGTDADVFKIGEDIWTPATAGDALRYMANPTQDGSSRDYYPERYVGTSDNGGVHWNSGIANLAFKLLVTGGTHPRAKTSINVTGIGMQRAGAIFYRANKDYLTSSSNFASARSTTVQAATELYGSTVAASVTQAWDAVGVPSSSSGSVTTLTNGVTVTGISGASGSAKYYKLTVPSGRTSLGFVMSGGTGDADLYVRYGSLPTTSAYNCRPYLNGNNESCNFSNPTAGDWFVMIRGYTSYSGTSLKGTY